MPSQQEILDHVMSIIDNKATLPEKLVTLKDFLQKLNTAEHKLLSNTHTTKNKQRNCIETCLLSLENKEREQLTVVLENYGILSQTKSKPRHYSFKNNRDEQSDDEPLDPDAKEFWQKLIKANPDLLNASRELQNTSQDSATQQSQDSTSTSTSLSDLPHQSSPFTLFLPDAEPKSPSALTQKSFGGSSSPDNQEIPSPNAYQEIDLDSSLS